MLKKISALCLLLNVVVLSFPGGVYENQFIMNAEQNQNNNQNQLIQSQIQHQEIQNEIQNNMQQQSEQDLERQSETGYLNGEMQLSGEIQNQQIVGQQTFVKSMMTQQLVSQPLLRRRIIEQPLIKKRIIQRKLISQNETLPAVEKENTINENFSINIPANKETINTNIQPMLHTINQNLNLQRLPSKQINQKPIVLPVQIKNEQNERVWTAPVQQISHHSTLIPINTIHKENVKLAQQPDDCQTAPTQNLEPIVKETQIQKEFSAPGNAYQVQPILYTQVQQNHTHLQIEREPTKYVNREAITNAPHIENKIINQVVHQPGQLTIQQPIIQNNVRNQATHVVHNPVINHVDQVSHMAIPVPVLKHEEVVKKIPYKVVLPKPKPIQNDQNIHIKIKRKQRRAPQVVEKQQNVRYRRNFERQLDNNGFFHS
jgi:hypothetical protein